MLALAILMVANSAIAVYYYLRVVKEAVFGDASKVRYTPLTALLLAPLGLAPAFTDLGGALYATVAAVLAKGAMRIATIGVGPGGRRLARGRDHDSFT